VYIYACVYVFVHLCVYTRVYVYVFFSVHVYVFFIHLFSIVTTEPVKRISRIEKRRELVRAL